MFGELMAHGTQMTQIEWIDTDFNTFYHFYQ